jgi:hypothetical protein
LARALDRKRTSSPRVKTEALAAVPEHLRAIEDAFKLAGLEDAITAAQKALGGTTPKGGASERNRH